MEEKKEEVKQEGDFKIKKKRGRPRKLVPESDITKVDLSKKEETKTEEDAIQIGETKEVPVGESSENSPKVDEKVRVESNEPEVKQEEEKPVIEEIKETEEVKPKEIVAKPEPVVEAPQLPENVNKLVSFMKETGGTLEDYVRLNRDYSEASDEALLHEYYKRTKPHLDQEEINFVLEDNFYFDDEVDDERTVKKKKVARKEEIAKAKNFLEETKKKYYDEIKLRPGVTQEQQKAMDFFNRYNKEQENRVNVASQFQERTKNFFDQQFKGFEYNLGEKKFRYGVNNTDAVSKDQASLDNFLRRFLDDNGQITDMAAYHKALYSAKNADTIAKHFYEQGKADGTRDVIAKSKNIDSSARPATDGDIFIGGLKVKAISGDDSSKLKIQRRFNKK
jgi:hypothetical protein